MGISEDVNDGVLKARESLLTRLAARWEVLRARKGLVDFDVAVWAREVRDAFAGSAKGRAEYWRRLGIDPRGTGKTHLNMAATLDMVPSVAVWRALGGYSPGLTRLAGISDAKARANACKRIVDAHEQIKATTPPAGIERETKKAAANIINAVAPIAARAKTVTGVERHFAAFVKRVTGTGYAFVADLLTPEERKAAGLPAKGKKSKAS